MVAVPASGFTRPSSIRKVVVFPAPLGPRKPVTVPPSTPKLRSPTASTGPNRLVSPDTSITAIGDPSLPAPRAVRVARVALCAPAVRPRKQVGEPARGEDHQRHHGHAHRVTGHPKTPFLIAVAVCYRVAARKAAAAAGASTSPAAASAINVRRSWPQSLPVLI